MFLLLFFSLLLLLLVVVVVVFLAVTTPKRFFSSASLSTATRPGEEIRRQNRFFAERKTSSSSFEIRFADATLNVDSNNERRRRDLRRHFFDGERSDDDDDAETKGNRKRKNNVYTQRLRSLLQSSSSSAEEVEIIEPQPTNYHVHVDQHHVSGTFLKRVSTFSRCKTECDGYGYQCAGFTLETTQSTPECALVGRGYGVVANAIEGVYTFYRKKRGVDEDEDFVGYDDGNVLREERRRLEAKRIENVTLSLIHI